jgi:hypothetical protein
MSTMSYLLPKVRQYYAEVGVILEMLLGEAGRELVPRVLARLSRQSERVQALVEHEDPFQVALEVGNKIDENWEETYESFRKLRTSADWQKAVQAFDQRYLDEFAAVERRQAVARIVAAHLSHNKVSAAEVRDV